MKGACQTTQQTGFRFSSREYFACTCTNRNDGDMDTSALLPFVHGSKYVVPFVFTTCYVFPPLLPPFIDGTECVVLYDLVFLCIRFQYRRRSSSYCLSSWGRVELRPLRFIISRDVHSLRTNKPSILFWISDKCNMRRDYAFVLGRSSVYYIFNITMGTFILVEGSQLATINTRKCYLTTHCQPAQQPVEYAHPQCSRLPEMVRLASRPP